MPSFVHTYTYIVHTLRSMLMHTRYSVCILYIRQRASSTYHLSSYHKAQIDFAERQNTYTSGPFYPYLYSTYRVSFSTERWFTVPTMRWWGMRPASKRIGSYTIGMSTYSIYFTNSIVYTVVIRSQQQSLSHGTRFCIIVLQMSSTHNRQMELHH